MIRRLLRANRIMEVAVIIMLILKMERMTKKNSLLKMHNYLTSKNKEQTNQ